MATNRSRTLLYAALAVAAWLRLGELGREGLWLDELFTVRVVMRESWAAMSGDLGADVHPPAWFAGMRVWSQLLTMSDPLWRLPSALAGVLGVWVASRLAERLAGTEAGVGAAWLLATAPTAVLLDREARSNALLALLATAAAWVLASEARHALVVLCVAVLVHVHYFGILVAAGLAAWALTHGDRRGAGAVALGSLAILPLAPTMLGQASSASASPWYVVPSPDSLGVITSGLCDDRPGLVLLLVVGAVVALREAPRAAILLVAGCFSLVLVPQVLSYELTPILRVRSAIALLPLWAVAAAAGYRGLGPAGTAMIALTSAAQGIVAWRATRAETRMEAWREAAALVDGGGELVLANHSQLWRWYLPEDVWLREAAAPEVDAAPGAWVLLAHDLDEPPALSALTAGVEVRQEQRLFGAWARKLGPIARPITMEAAPGTPGLVDGARVELWSNGGVVSGELRVRGRCAVEVEGSEDPAGTEHAELRVRLQNADGIVIDERLQLGPTPASVQTSASLFPLFGEPGQAPVRLSLDFVNDALIDGRDRNVHILAVRLRCSD